MHSRNGLSKTEDKSGLGGGMRNHPNLTKNYYKNNKISAIMKDLNIIIKPERQFHSYMKNM